jgi:hypothetical protein
MVSPFVPAIADRLRAWMAEGASLEEAVRRGSREFGLLPLAQAVERVARLGPGEAKRLVVRAAARTA